LVSVALWTSATIVISAMATAGSASASSAWTPVFGKDFPDPTVLAYGGAFYAYSTQVWLYNVPGASSSDTLSWAGYNEDVMPSLAPWVAWGSGWAPTVERNVSGQFVMFYTAKDAQYDTQCIGRAVSSSPGGPFEDSNSRPVICTPSLGGDIDPDIFTAADGTSYLYYKNDGNSIGTYDAIWEVPLDQEFNVTSYHANEVLQADQPWQQGIIEGPDMFFMNGAYYLLYSAGPYYESSSGIGYALCASPAGPCYDSPDNPVLSTGSSVTGPSGPDVFLGPNGTLELAFAAWTALSYTALAVIVPSTWPTSPSPARLRTGLPPLLPPTRHL
jgi:beta-xylosidase